MLDRRNWCGRRRLGPLNAMVTLWAVGIAHWVNVIVSRFVSAGRMGRVGDGLKAVEGRVDGWA